MDEKAEMGPASFEAPTYMALSDAMASKHKLAEPALLPRKRFKASELPLTSIQRSSIDGLLHTIKKKGEYDSLRKRVWSQFEESVSLEVTLCRLACSYEKLNHPSHRRKRRPSRSHWTSLRKRRLNAIHRYCPATAAKQLLSCKVLWIGVTSTKPLKRHWTTWLIRTLIKSRKRAERLGELK